MSEETKEQYVSPFEEAKSMNLPGAVNVLLTAANAAQRAGALSVRDSVLVAAAGEFLSQYVNTKTEE